MNKLTHSILRVVRCVRPDKGEIDFATSDTTFRGSAIYLGGCYAITCWHVLVDRNYISGRWVEENPVDFEFEVSISDRRSIARVESVVKASPRHELDLVLLKLRPSVSEPWPEVGMRLLGEVTEAFMGSPEECAGAHLSDCERAEAFGYPGKSDGVKPAAYPINVASFQNRGRDDDTGLLMDWQLQQGGLLAGLSGGAIIGYRGDQAACLGMPYLGGAGAATSRVTVSNEIIEFLRDALPSELLEQIVIPISQFLPGVSEDSGKRYHERLRAAWERQFGEDSVDSQRRRVPFIETQELTLLTSPGDPRPYLKPEYFRSRRSGVATGQAEMTGTQDGAWPPIDRESLVSGKVTLDGGREIDLKRMVLTTDAGVGKTTNLRWLATRFNDAGSETTAVLVDHEAWQKIGNANHWLGRLATLLLNGCAAAGTDLQSRRRNRRLELHLKRKRDEGKLVVLLDGLDHATADQIAAIKQLLDEPDWASCRIILGGRPHALQRHWQTLFETTAAFPGVSEWRFIQASEFTEEEQREYLGVLPSGVNRFGRIPVEAREILGVPRVLEYLRELPEGDLKSLRTPSDVYWKSTRRLIERGLANNAVAHRLGGNLPGADQIDVAIELLAVIAFQMTAGRVVSADEEAQHDDDNETDAGQQPTLRPNFDSIPPTRYAEFRDLIWARMQALRVYDRRFDEFAADLNGLAAMNTVLSCGFFDNDTSDGLRGILWRNRSLQEFFAAVWLSRYLDCRADYSDSDGECLQLWIFTPDDVASEEYYEIWRFAAEMPEEGRNGLSWVRSLGVIYRLGDGTHATRRSNEMIYRSWEKMWAYYRGLGGEDAMKRAVPVLDDFRGEFESIILAGDRGDTLREYAQEFITSFVELEGDPAFRMGSPAEKQGRIPEVSLQSWKVWLATGGDDLAAHVDQFLSNVTFSEGKPGQRERNALRRDLERFHKTQDFEAICRRFCPTNETPAVSVQQVDGFQLSHSPTLNRWYRLYDSGHGLRSTEYQKRYDTISAKDDSPAICVSWYDAWAFCRWAFWERQGCRLPTELDWEYAAKGGTDWDWDYWWHETEYLPKFCNADDQNGGTLPPTEERANPFGLRDMLGNVWEWSADWYRRQYSREVKEPTSVRVLRGGSYGSIPAYCRSACRSFNVPTIRYSFVGFRVARASAPKP